MVASRDDPSGLVQFGCFVGQFICHLVDVKIADRHVLEIRECGFFVSVGGRVVVFVVQWHSQCIRLHPFFLVCLELGSELAGG